MGNWNCKKRDQALTVTNFEDDKWAMVNTSLHPLCFMLKNYYHPTLRLFKWLATNNKEDSISKWRNDNKNDFLPIIYESGITRTISQPTNQSSFDCQKRSYIVVQQLACLKDLKVSEAEATVLAYKSLQAYEILIKLFGGFVALENMIFVNREGVVKVWVNENLADSWIQYPHPAITQEEFVGSLLNHIFTKVEGESNGVYEYIKMGSVTFSEVLAKLKSSIEGGDSPFNIGLQKEKFDKIMDSYQGKQKLSKKQGKKMKTLIQQSTNSSSSLNKLKFIVADTPSSPKASQKNDAQYRKQYIKDYSQKQRSQFVSSSSSIIPLPQQQQAEPILLMDRRIPYQSINVQSNQIQGYPIPLVVPHQIQYINQPVYVGNQVWGL